MKRAAVFLLLLAASLSAQVSTATARRIARVSALPATCNVGDVVHLTAGSTGPYTCLATNTWRAGVLKDASGNVAIGTTVLSPTAGIKGPIIACVGAPGDTAGPYGSACNVRATGALWSCTNAAGCTVAADWASVGAAGAGDVGGAAALTTANRLVTVSAAGTVKEDTGCTTNGTGTMTCGSYQTSGSGPDVFSAIADGTTANSFWLSSTTANAFKAYLNGTLYQFAFGDDTAYNEATWNGVTNKSPTQNAVRDKLEALAPSGVVADSAIAAKYKVWHQDFGIDAPVTGDSGKYQFVLPFAGTVTSVSCSIGAATSVTINLEERAAATPNTAGTAVLTADLVCDVDSAVSTTFSNATLAADVPVALTVIAVSGTPGVVRVHVKGTID